MTISKDRVKPSPLPDSWKLAEIFTTGIVLGSYLAMMTVIFFWAAYKTDFFPVRSHMFTVFTPKGTAKSEKYQSRYEIILLFFFFGVPVIYSLRFSPTQSHTLIVFL